MAERGANCLVVVAGHPTAVTNSAIAGVVEEAGRGDFIADIFGASAGVSGLADGKLVDLGAQKRKVIEGLRRTPGSVLPGTHRVLGDADAGAMIDILRAREIGTIFVLGGLPAVGLLNFFASAAEKHNYPLLSLGLPLSAENDVDAGDHTPGYGSSARFAASAARDAGRAAASGEQPLLVLELLGDETGWLAASSVLARDAQNPAPHCVLVPEKTVNVEALTDEMRRAYQKYGYAVAVTTPGVKDTDGNSLAGDALTALLSEKLGIAGRCDKPGSLARVGQAAISRADADEAYNLGTLAVRLAGDECSSYLVTAQRDAHSVERGDKGYRSVEGSARLDQVKETARLLPDSHLTPNGTQLSESFSDWARPLVGGALPEYISLV
ncbi:MAG TPA: 6-phosphofructokinase [Abditibacteriaceae bacterium]|jgi:6-phosphofructokinase 1